MAEFKLMLISRRTPCNIPPSADSLLYSLGLRRLTVI